MVKLIAPIYSWFTFQISILPDSAISVCFRIYIYREHAIFKSHRCEIDGLCGNKTASPRLLFYDETYIRARRVYGEDKKQQIKDLIPKIRFAIY